MCPIHTQNMRAIGNLPSLVITIDTTNSLPMLPLAATRSEVCMVIRIHIYERFEVLLANTVKIIVHQDVMPFSLLQIHQSSGGKC
jgi:hypothetical protein